MAPTHSAPGGGSGKVERPARGPMLYAILRCGLFRCALDAHLVEGFDAAEAGEVVEEAVPLARCLGLPSLLPGGRQAEHVHLSLGGRPLLVDQVEAIINPGEAGVLELPALTRLKRPVFRAVLCLSDGAIVPVLELSELLAMDEEARG